MSVFSGLLGMARRSHKNLKGEAPNEPTSLFDEPVEWIDPPLPPHLRYNELGEIEPDVEYALRQRVRSLHKESQWYPWLVGGAGYGGYKIGQSEADKE